ncbi:MAG: nicotinamide-nucleotide amidohydrolase family protein [Acholeplasmataceae bacterium]|jgi:PncC family amidohydrolase|nr:nicotinamide-nucleotide amidohydrolase family protein [Acholeplasmataceae bacterium]
MKATKLFNLLKSQGKVIAFAESITGGALAANLIAIPGASQVIKQSFITYNEITKQNTLDVSPNLIKRYGIVSREVAEAMNAGLKNITKADVYVSITGNAGPTYQGNDTQLKEAFVAVDCGHTKQVFQIDLRSKSRQANINKAVKMTYQHVIEVLSQV